MLHRLRVEQRDERAIDFSRVQRVRQDCPTARCAAADVVAHVQQTNRRRGIQGQVDGLIDANQLPGKLVAVAD